MTNEAILLTWLRRQLVSGSGSADICTHEVEEVPKYALDYHFKRVTVGVITRLWRQVRIDGTLALAGIRVQDVSDEYPMRKESTWRVERSS